MTPNQPNFIEMPFAYNGGRNTIPASGGEEDGNASLAQGFPQITEQPILQGGLPPQRKDFNGILYALSSFQFFAQAGGIFTYSADLDYRTPALVWYNNNLYICVKNNGPESTVITPGTNSDYWKDFGTFISGGTGSITAGKLGTSTVGGVAQGMYLDAGSPKAMSATVGSASTGVYLKNGVITACTSGSGTAYITATGHSGPSWYRKYSDGFIEQGGIITIEKGGTSVPFHIPMTTTDYIVMMTKQSENVDRYSADAYYTNKTTSSFIGMCCNQAASPTWKVFVVSWRIAGY